MKVYSTKINSDDVREAFRLARLLNGADIYQHDVREFRPRKPGYTRGVELYAYSHNGTRAVNPGRAHWTTEDLPRAASWDNYGYVIAHLFKIDSKAIIGGYNGKRDFIRQVREYAPYRRPRTTAPFLALVTK